MNVFRNILGEIETIKKDRIGDLGRRLKAVSAMRDPSGRILPEAKDEGIKVFLGVIEANDDLVKQVNMLVDYTCVAVMNMVEKINELEDGNRQYKQYLRTKKLGKDFRNFKKLSSKS